MWLFINLDLNLIYFQFISLKGLGKLTNFQLPGPDIVAQQNYASGCDDSVGKMSLPYP